MHAKSSEVDMLLSELNYLTEGWESYHAPKPESEAIRNAANFINLFPSFKPVQISPCADGGVTLLYSLGQNNILIDCYNSGEVVSASWQSTDKPRAEEIGLNLDKINTLSKWLYEGTEKCATA